MKIEYNGKVIEVSSSKMLTSAGYQHNLADNHGCINTPSPIENYPIGQEIVIDLIPSVKAYNPHYQPTIIKRLT